MTSYDFYQILDYPIEFCILSFFLGKLQESKTSLDYPLKLEFVRSREEDCRYVYSHRLGVIVSDF